jgi:SAM-dependent methyltransferase
MLDSQPDSPERYYEDEYRDRHGPVLGVHSDYGEMFDAYVRYQAGRVNLLKPWLRPNMRLLEVGCSTGHFLYNVKDLVTEVVGVDYDSAAAAFAAGACGCTTFGGDIRDSGVPLHSFDVVCAIQVMEHVKDPIAFLSTLGQYLKPGGIVYVEVPNLDEALLSVYEESSYRSFYFHDAHLFYLTRRSLLTVMQRAGFSGEVHYLQDYNLFNHLHWLTRHAPQASCHPGMATPRLPLASNQDAALAREVNAWLTTVDAQYKAILAKHGATDNLSFIGTVGA